MTNVANEADADSALRRQLRSMDLPIADMALASSTAVRAVAGAVGQVIGARAAARRVQSLDEFNALFHVIGLPPIAKDFHQDATFAQLFERQNNRTAAPCEQQFQSLQTSFEATSVRIVTPSSCTKGQTRDGQKSAGHGVSLPPTFVPSRSASPLSPTACTRFKREDEAPAMIPLRDAHGPTFGMGLRLRRLLSALIF